MSEKIEIEFKVSDLKDIINRCSKFTKKLGMVQELKCIYVSKDFIKAHDGWSGIIDWTIHGKVNKDFPPFLINGDLINEVVNSLADDANLKIIISDSEIKLKCKKLSAKFERSSFKTSIFDDLLPTDDSNFIDLPSSFKEVMKKISWSVSKDETKPSFRAINFENGYFYSTDNIRVTRIKPLFDFDSIPIHDNMVIRIVNEPKIPIKYKVENAKIWVMYEGQDHKFLIFTNNMKEKFIPCHKKFEDVFSSRKDLVTFDPVQFSVLGERIKTFVANVYPYSLLIQIEKNSIIFMSSANGGEVLEKFTCKTDIENFVLNANAKLFFEPNEKAEASRFYVFPDNPTFVLFENDPEKGEKIQSILVNLGVDDAARLSISRIRSHFPIGEGEETTKTIEGTEGGNKGSEDSQGT